MENSEKTQPNPATDKIVKSKEEMNQEEKLKGARSTENMADLRLSIDRIDKDSLKE